MSDMTIDIVGYLRRNLKHPKQLDFTDDVIWFVGDMEQELARTKKQLKIALDALKLFDSGQYTPQPDSYGLKTDASRLARNTLEQITAEQKD